MLTFVGLLIISHHPMNKPTKNYYHTILSGIDREMRKLSEMIIENYPKQLYAQFGSTGIKMSRILHSLNW